MAAAALALGLGLGLQAARGQLSIAPEGVTEAGWRGLDWDGGRPNWTRTDSPRTIWGRSLGNEAEGAGRSGEEGLAAPMSQLGQF